MRKNKPYFWYQSKKRILTILFLITCFLSLSSMQVLASSQINKHAVMDTFVTPVSGGDGGTTDSVVQRIISTTYNIITHKVLFPASTVKDALVNAFNDMTASAAEETEDYLRQALYATFQWLYGKDASYDVKLTGWNIMLVIASAIMPLSLILTVGAAMKEGVTSVTGYAAAREAITEWIISIALAGGSFYIIHMLTDVSIAASYKILDQTVSTWHVDAADYLVGSFITAMKFNNVHAVGKMFLSLFAVFTCIAVVASIMLAIFAREVILLLLTVISPVVFILAPINQTKWLSGLWTKAFTFTLLLGPINALLISAGGMLYKSSIGNSSLLGMVIAIGVVSVLITINQAVGQMIYGAAIEIGKKTWDSAVGIVKTAATALGYAYGGSLVGAAVGGLGNNLQTNGLGGNSNNTNLTQGDGGDLNPKAPLAPMQKRGDSTGDMKDVFEKKRAVSNDVANAGRQLANSGIPGLSQFGAGMQAAGGLGEMQALGQMGQANRNYAAKAASNDAMPMRTPVNSAKSELKTAYNGLPENRRPTSKEIDSGINHAVAGMDAYSQVGGNMTSYLSAATGYSPDQVNSNFAGSTESVLKADASQFIGINSVSYRGMMYPAGDKSLPYNWVREDKGVTAHDVRFAMDAVKTFHNEQAENPTFIAGVAAAASSARQYGGITYSNMMNNFSNGGHMNHLDQWALKTATRFTGGPKAGSINLDSHTMENIVRHFNKNR